MTSSTSGPARSFSSAKPVSRHTTSTSPPATAARSRWVERIPVACACRNRGTPRASSARPSIPPICDDLEIFYDLAHPAQGGGQSIRQVKPSIILTHPPQDYMEDHTNTCRLAVTAGFTHGMPNFVTNPPSDDTYPEDVFIYHSVPHGLCDQLRVPTPDRLLCRHHLRRRHPARSPRRPRLAERTGSTNLRARTPTSKSSTSWSSKVGRLSPAASRKPKAGAATCTSATPPAMKIPWWRSWGRSIFVNP